MYYFDILEVLIEHKGTHLSVEDIYILLAEKRNCNIRRTNKTLSVLFFKHKSVTRNGNPHNGGYYYVYIE